MPIKAIIFDRDATLNKWQNKKSHGYVLTPDEMELLPNVKKGLELANEHGITSFIFTQQRCVNKGLVSTEILNNIHAKMQDLLGSNAPIEKVYYCPHLADENCNCGKPKPGMILSILADYNLKPEEVIVMGDAKRDWQSAQNAKTPFVFIKSEKHSAEEYRKTGIKTYNNILNAIEDIIK
jgi:D-glycero-D-manno-heptose 1,7-bisphosphate phosphatase